MVSPPAGVADDLQPFDPATPAGGDTIQCDLRQSEFRTRQLTIVTGRLRRSRRVGGAGGLGATRRLRGTALPIAGTRQRGRVDAADPDARKVSCSRCRIV